MCLPARRVGWPLEFPHHLCIRRAITCPANRRTPPFGYPAHDFQHQARPALNISLGVHASLLGHSWLYLTPSGEPGKLSRPPRLPGRVDNSITVSIISTVLNWLGRRPIARVLHSRLLQSPFWVSRSPPPREACLEPYASRLVSLALAWSEGRPWWFVTHHPSRITGIVKACRRCGEGQLEKARLQREVDI